MCIAQFFLEDVLPVLLNFAPEMLEEVPQMVSFMKNGGFEEIARSLKARLHDSLDSISKAGSTDDIFRILKGLKRTDMVRRGGTHVSNGVHG